MRVMFWGVRHYVNEFEFISSYTDGVFIAEPVGELDLATAQQLGDALIDHLNDPSAAPVVVRLDRVTFIDSTGINTLVKAHRLASQRSIHLNLAAPTSIVRKVLGIMDLEGVIPVHTTLQMALVAACPDRDVPG